MSDESNVARLFGVAAPEPGKPDEKVVAVLEHYLAQAKRGEITAVTLSGVRPTRSTFWDWNCASAPANLLVAAAAMLQHELVSAVIDQSVRDEPYDPDSA